MQAHDPSDWSPVHPVGDSIGWFCISCRSQVLVYLAAERFCCLVCDYSKQKIEPLRGNSV